MASPPKMSKFITDPKSDQEVGIPSERMQENDKENDKPETNFLQVIFLTTYLERKTGNKK